MKNILLIGSVLSGGGAERVIANIAKYLDRDHFNLTICHLKERGEIGEELEREGYHVVGVSPPRSVFSRYFSFFKLRNIVVKNKIDLIHSHTTHSLVDGALVRCTLPGVKMVHTFHYGNYPNYVKRYMYMEQVFSRFSNRLVAVGMEQRKTICTAYGIAPERILTAFNGVEWLGTLPDQEWMERLTLAGRLVIGTICTFIEQKGLTYLLDSALHMAQQGSDVVFVVVGDGPLRPEIEEKCRRLGLTDRVFFTGWKPNAASSMLPLFDVFFQPSLWEAMSMVVLEAMAAGLPVVVTDVGDNHHVVLDGVTGLVVSPKDVGAMVLALKTLVDSKDLRQQFGESGRQRFEQYYTARAMAQRYEDLYSEVLG